MVRFRGHPFHRGACEEQVGRTGGTTASWRWGASNSDGRCSRLRRSSCSAS